MYTVPGELGHARSLSSKPNFCLDVSLATEGTAEDAVLLYGLVPFLKTEGFLGHLGLESSQASH